MQDNYRRAAGQREKLTTRLNQLIRDYPEGVGIFKELLQNADDAGASKIHFILDWRRHQVEPLPGPQMQELLSPALLVYNDAIFTDEDFQSIEQLGNSLKISDLTKTGRFGLGFNSVYHLTDYPSFLSRDQIVFFDPHCKTIPGADPFNPGAAWHFGPAHWWRDYPKFLDMYGCAGLRSGTEIFPGTIFRLPLRTAEQARKSEIRAQAITSAKMAELLQTLSEAGESLLLFLKSVQSIQISEISEQGESHLRLLIETLNPKEVKVGRGQVQAEIAAGWEHLRQRVSQSGMRTTWQQRIRFQEAGPARESVWHISQGLGNGETLLEIMDKLYLEKEKALPWVGVALRLEPLPQESGRICCFLPLPLETGHPVHVHGYFDLDTSRTSLTSPNAGLTGRDALRARWNQLLGEQVAKFWAHLLVETRNLLPLQNWWSIWPTAFQGPAALQDLPEQVFALLSDQPVIPSASQNGWSTPEEVCLPRKEQTELLAILSQDCFPVPREVVPAAILEGLAQAGVNWRPLEQRQVLQWYTAYPDVYLPLADHPFAGLRQIQSVAILLNWLLGEIELNEIVHSPLLVFENNYVCSWGYKPALLSQDSRLVKLAPDISAQRVHRVLCSSVPKLNSNSELRLSALNARWLYAMAAQKWGRWPSGKKNWKNHQDPPPDWLELFFQVLNDCDNLALAPDLQKEVCLLPTNAAYLYHSAQNNSPFWTEETHLAVSLHKLNIPLLSQDLPWKKIFVEILRRHPEQNLFKTLNPLLLLEALDPISDWSDFPLEDCLNLLTYFDKRAQFSDWNTVECQNLKSLPIFPTADGQLVSLVGSNTYRIAGFEAPALPLTLTLLAHGPGYALAEALGIPALSPAKLVKEQILPRYSQFSVSEQMTALDWIRRNLSGLQEEDPQLLTLLRQTPLILSRSGQRLKASELYLPDDALIEDLLGESADFPDPGLYASDWNRWQPFFSLLGMKSQPEPQDIYHHVLRLTVAGEKLARLEQELTQPLREDCIRVLNWLLKHAAVLSEVLPEENQTLAEALKALAWYPVECDPQFLQKYAAAKTPVNKLYHSAEVFMASRGHLVASQAPMLAFKQQPGHDLLALLGFPLQPSAPVLLDHFRAVVEWGAQLSKTTPRIKEVFLTSLEELYRHLHLRFVNRSMQSEEQEREQKLVKEALSNYPSVWDPIQAEMRFPDHCFERGITCLKKYRSLFKETREPLRALFFWIGMQEEAGLMDCVALIQELALTWKQKPLPEDVQSDVLSLLSQIEARRGLEEATNWNPENIYLLSDTGQLTVPEDLYLPDAPWWLDSLDRSRIQILHPRIPLGLGRVCGCPSLLGVIVSRPLKEMQSEERSQFLTLAKQWQERLNHPAFIQAVQRLIWDEQDLEKLQDLGWMGEIKICVARDLRVNLWLGDKIEVASGVEGNYYYDPQTQRIWLRSSGEIAMLADLNKALQSLLEERVFALHRHRDLLMIFFQASHTDELADLMDHNRVRALPGQSQLPDSEWEDGEETTSFQNLNVNADEPDPPITDWPRSEERKSNHSPAQELIPLPQSPAVPIDQHGLQNRFNHARIQSAPSRNRERKTGESQQRLFSLDVNLLAPSFENGQIWVPRLKHFVKNGEMEFTLFLESRAGAEPLLMQVFRSENLLLPVSEHAERMVNWLNQHQLIAGCILRLTRLENDQVLLDYAPEPHKTGPLPLLCLDASGSPAIAWTEEEIEVPCKIDRPLMLGQQRFSDPEAWMALQLLSRRAPDLIHMLIQLVEKAATPPTFEELYLLSFQVRPVAWQTFKKSLDDNTGNGLLFNKDEHGRYRLNPEAGVEVIFAPRMKSAATDWESLSTDLLRVLGEVIHQPQRVLEPLLEVFKRWQSR